MVGLHLAMIKNQITKYNVNVIYYKVFAIFVCNPKEALALMFCRSECLLPVDNIQNVYLRKQRGFYII